MPLNSPTHRVACLLVMLAACLFLFPANAGAVPLDMYQQKLKLAIKALYSLAEASEDGTEADFQGHLNGTSVMMSGILPEQMTVESDGDVCNVDNAWLYKSLDELKELTGDEQQEKLGEIIEKLRAIEARVAERMLSEGRLEDKNQAKNRLDTILARPEFVAGAQGPNALSRLVQRFLRWLEGLFPKRRTVDAGRANLITRVAQIVVIGLAVAVLIYVAHILLRRFGRTRKTKEPKKSGPRIVLGERLEPEATSTDLLSQAELLARSGDLRAAIRKAYIALLVELGDRKLISLAQHKTNRDYLNSVRNVPPLHATMRGLTESFERHWYGFESATPDDWQTFRAGYLAALQR